MLITASWTYAEDSTIFIKHADLKQEAGQYILSADLEISLDAEIEEAINKGVEVTFLYAFGLEQSRRYWFDKAVVEKDKSVVVSYHALSRQYLVNHDGHQTSHDILSEAMIELVQMYDWPVFDATLIKPDKTYVCTLTVKLDKTKLPKAIQVDSIKTEDWNVESEPYHWIVDRQTD